MAVVLPNATLTCRVAAHPAPRDPHGKPLGGGEREVRGPLLGSLEAPADGEDSQFGWTIGLDPSMWPLRPGDEVVDEHGRVFVVDTARLNTLPPGYGWVDHVRVLAHRTDPTGF